MTTIVVTRKSGELCIAADTLARFGSTRETADYVANHEKILRVGRTYLALTGHASFQLVVGSYFKDPESPRDFSSPSAVFETFRAMHGTLKERYFLNPKEDDEDPFESTQMDALVADPSGIYGVYSLRSVQEYTRFYALGSGFAYALGAMHALYESQATAQDLARAAIAAAATFDDGTELPLTSHSLALER